MSDIQRKKPTFSLESGQFSSQLEGYTILSRKVDSISGVLLGVTIYDMMQFQRRNIISADSGIIKFSGDFKSLIIDLYHGEVHQFSINTIDNYRIVKFDDYKISIPAQGFAYEQSSAEMVSRGDRELKISDMNQIVDSATANRKVLLVQIDSVIKNAVKEMLFANTVKTAVKTDMTFQSKLSVNSDTSKRVNKSRKTKALKQISPKDISKEKFDSILKAKIEMNKRLVTGYIQKDTLKIKKSAVQDTKPAVINKKPVVLDLNNTDTNRISILSRVMQKTNIQKSIIQGEVNQAEYYNSKIEQYDVEIFKKYSIPFACFVFVFVGVPLGVITRGGNFGLSAGISLLFYIFYWACLIAGEKLADRGIMASWLAMWLGNIIIGVLGIILTLKVNYESIFIFNNNLIEKINKIKMKILGLFRK
jgi:lipopolysaccharide export system permease protein